MKTRALYFTLMAVILSSSVFLPPHAPAGEAPSFVPDKALCAQMIRFGKQSYQRGKFLDAKEFFRRAVQADPASLVAWRYYDMSVISALAEKVNKDAGLLAPDVSLQGPAQAKAAAPPPPAPKPVPQKKEKFVIEEDEGC
ncbi:MAG: hypothetical protein JRJ09_17170 [Deltaproteobacteria bacterium]|nr:hypothetical protein [Deltaproteobacteria bacterium]MBW2113010.1 hypothetical protein [Deltaproteobacteria bacterium]MBW2352342.1 hypothetical protein [Deltaproteobacteria bacterium]